VELLKIRLGEEAPEIKVGTDMDDIPAQLTVQSIANGVMDILNSLPEKCTNCGAQQWTAEDGAKVKCGNCGEPAVYTNGDDLAVEWLKNLNAEKKIF